MPFPLTIVYEPYYVDRIYRDEYYTYYSKKHFGISRNTKRFIFFKGCYYKESFLDGCNDKQQDIERDLIGMVVIKPTQTIGRMLINPFLLNIPSCYVRTTKFEISVLGRIYTVDAFPLSGQDSEVMTCAEVNMWQIMEYFGSRYSDYRTLLPSEMLDLITIIVNDKSFFLLSLAAPIFAACKRRFTLQKSCASPGGAIVNGNYFCRLL